MHGRRVHSAVIEAAEWRIGVFSTAGSAHIESGAIGRITSFFCRLT